MFKRAVVFLLSVLSVVVFAADKTETKNPAYLERKAQELNKVIELNYKFQAADYQKLCKKNELSSECFKAQIAKLHKTDKLSVAGLMVALPAGKGLIVKEKERQFKQTPKKSNSELSLISHRKQAEMGIFLLNLSCTAATPKDWGVTDEKTIQAEMLSAQDFLKIFKKIVTAEIEHVRKYSDDESVALRMKFDSTLVCGKKN